MSTDGRVDGPAEILVADLVGAAPVRRLTEVVGDDGAPESTAEVVEGLFEHGLVPFDGGHRELTEAPVPTKVRERVERELAALSPITRHAAVVTAALGAFATPDQIASMLETSAAALLGPVEALMRIGMLVDVGARLRVPGPLVRRAVLETVSPALRQALQRRAIEVLVRDGDSPIEAAMGLASTAEPGDRASMPALLTAARAVERGDAAAAAELSLTACRISGPGDDHRTELIAETARRLHVAGRAQEGCDLVEGALRERPSPEAEARIRLSVAHMSDLAPEVGSEACRRALALPGLPRALQARHLAAQISNVATEGRPDLARTLLAAAEVTVIDTGDVAAMVTLDAARAQLAYMRGAYHATIRLLEPLDQELLATDDADADADEQARRVGLLRGEALLAVDEFDAVERLIIEGLGSAERGRRLAGTRAWKRLQGRCALQMGRLVDAAAILEPVFSAEAGDAVASVCDAATMTALGRIAIHRGDGRRARMLAKLAQHMTSRDAPEVRRHASWLLALYASAVGDVETSRRHLLTFGSEGLDDALPMLMRDPTDHVHLVRLAVDAGEIALARCAAAAIAACADANPGARSIRGAAVHARGLLDRDPSALAKAVELLTAGPRPMAHAWAAEDHGVELARTRDRQAAVDALGDALRLYTYSGASWDASRVRSRLRALGVRRRIVKPTRPTAGWGGLTEAELAVVRRVAEGLTNRQAAEQLYLSPHTVSMHLRHVFTKLQINSRVELARLCFEREAAG